MTLNDHADEKIVGDAEIYEFPAGAFDAIVCWDVLEHLRNPDLAMGRLTAALAPDGIIIIAAPLVISAKGLLTKFTPHSVHIWARRRAGFKRAGRSGRAPFKTYMRLSIDPASLIAFAMRHELTVEHVELYRTSLTETLLRRSRAARIAWQIAACAARAAALGRGDPHFSDLVLVLKRESPTSLK